MQKNKYKQSNINLSQNAKEVLAADFSYSRMLGQDLVSHIQNKELGKSLYSYRYRDPSKSNEVVVINDISKDGSVNRFTFPLSPAGEPVTEMTNLAVTADEATGALLLNIKTKTAHIDAKIIELNGKYFRLVNKRSNKMGNIDIGGTGVVINNGSISLYSFKNILADGEQIIDVKVGIDTHAVYSVNTKGQVFSYIIQDKPDVENYYPKVIRKDKVSDALAKKLGILISHSQFEPKKPVLKRESVATSTDATNYGVTLGNGTK